MADVTRELKQYLEKISLSQAQKEHLRTSRDSLAEKIKEHFEKNERKKPVFKQQGSFDMGTIITPISGEYDLDYGVYLQGYSDEESTWPTPQTVHNWVIEAVKVHTTTAPVDKKTCVRVIFKGKYHIDLPSYIESNRKCKLSRRDEWVQSQPKDISIWFQQQVKIKGEMLRDVVKILKGWADFQSETIGKMPSGLILTILAANNFVERDRLDECVCMTSKAIATNVKNIVDVVNPTDSNERISDRLSDTIKKRFQDAIAQLANKLDAACKEKSFAASSRIWIGEFGGRFPEATDPDDKLKNNIALLAKKCDSKSTIKPWGYEL